MRNALNGLRFRRISGLLGAEVSGIDLSNAIDDRTVAAIRAGLLEHLVLVFRGRSLEPGSLAAFARRFGALNRHPYVKPLEGHLDVFRIIKEPDDVHHFGNGWHSDLSYAERPALATMLYATELPPYGGDTLFTDMRAAWRTLSDGMKAMLDGLVAVFSNERTYGPDAARFTHGVKRMEVAQQATITRVEHPVVRTHPESGIKGAVPESAPYRRIQGHDRGGVATSHRLPLPARGPPGVPVPRAMAARHARVLGQPRDDALRGR